jgi:BolA protein
MNSSCEKIRHLLETEFQPEALQIEDESWKHAGHAGAKESGGGHFIVHITTEKFVGKSRAQCHRLVYDALKPLFPTSIHALSIHAKTPEQD